jgi:hypothetical protein
MRFQGVNEGWQAEGCGQFLRMQLRGLKYPRKRTGKIK